MELAGPAASSWHGKGPLECSPHFWDQCVTGDVGNHLEIGCWNDVADLGSKYQLSSLSSFGEG